MNIGVFQNTGNFLEIVLQRQVVGPSDLRFRVFSIINGLDKW